MEMEMDVNVLRAEFGLPVLGKKEIAAYQRRVDVQNKHRSEFGLGPIPLLLGEVQEVALPHQVVAFVSRFAPCAGSFVICPAYVAACGGSGEESGAHAVQPPHRRIA